MRNKTITELQEIFDNKYNTLKPAAKDRLLNEEGIRTLEFVSKVSHQLAFYKDGDEKEFLQLKEIEDLTKEYSDCKFCSNFASWRKRQMSQ